MACTTQSAVEYVRHAKNHLIRELRNLSVIFENLCQKGVLGDEEVSNIQAKTTDYEKVRELVGKVTKKGEAACYEFLRIIDRTRKRTLGRSSLPEKSSIAAAETRRFDLNHWISCYPFKEDTEEDNDYLQGARPCYRYQAKLKSRAQKISDNFWKSNKHLFVESERPDLSYTPLVLDIQGNTSPSKIKKLKNKKSKMSRPKKLRTYVPEDKPEISPSDLLKRDKDIVLVGKPGIGKTALTHQMLKLWAERDSKELDYMFYFDMRETSHFTKALSLEDLLFSVFSEPDGGKEEVLDDIKKNSDNVTVIFDGVTDLSSSVVRRLVEKDLLPYAKIIITCRSDDEEFRPTDFVRVEVKGFSEQSIKSYLSAAPGKRQVLSNLELLTLCHVPVYALMVAASFSADDSSQPRTVTEIYINIVWLCLKMNSKNTTNKNLNAYITSKAKEILSLAEVAFLATERKTVNLTEVSCEDGCVLSFLKPLVISVGPVKRITTYAFLHYTVQEFFAALWLLKNPDKIKVVFQQCQTEEKKHMKHLIPFMCHLLNEKKPSLMECLIPAEELKNTANWFFKELMTTSSYRLREADEADAEDGGSEVDILFLCQCLYESQCPEECISLLDKVDYCLDLTELSLDPYSCCAVAYVVTQSKARKIQLNLEDAEVSEQGMRRLFGCLENVQWCDPLPRQLWKISLLSECQMDHSLLSLDGNQLHLPVEGKKTLFERAVKVLQKIPDKVNVCLYWDRATRACQGLCESLLEALPHIGSLSFRVAYRGPGSQDQQKHHGTLQREEKGLLLDLCLKAALHEGERVHTVVNELLSLFSVHTDLHNIHLDFYQHVKTEGHLSLIPRLRPLFQSAPAVWSIDLRKRKSSILLEVLKLQSEKKPVELRGCSHEESEVRSFLQCLPHISQLSFVPPSSDPSDGVRICGNLFCAAAEREQQTGEKMLELLASVCTYKTFPLKFCWCDFLLDLWDYDRETGLRVLPALQSVLSAPAVWSIDLSERKSSILLEVLKLQSEKKPVELRGCSHEESEVRSFLQCLPHISRLSFPPWLRDSDGFKFCGNLFCAAAEREQQTGEKMLELLASVCTYKTFLQPEEDMDDDDDYYNQENKSHFLLDLVSHVKDYETETGLRVLPALQSVLSAPAVWSIDLRKRKSSILLEVLKLQSEKKPVELRGCSHEESEVRSFLQCLPHISRLSFPPWLRDSGGVKFCGNLFCAAAEREQQTGEKMLELLASVCTYKTFPVTDRYMGVFPYNQSHFLLDLFSHVKDYETETGLRVLPALQSVLSAPAVWSIDLRKGKSSILLEVLKLQSEKKPVELTGCSHEESEVRSFLQCLPHISRLSFPPWFTDSGGVKFCGNLFCAAAEREQQTGEKMLELLASVCTYKTFPVTEEDMDDDDYYYEQEYQSHFLLDLFSHVKDYETETGLRVLPALQSVLSAPAVWSIDLRKRKSSILLEVLKLQSEKKPVKLRGCSHEESEVRSFLQCLPHISQLSFSPWLRDSDRVKFCGNLFCAAAEREQQTGEKMLELLASVCTYKTFPQTEEDMGVFPDNQSDFLLDLVSHVKDYETETGLRVLPALQSVLSAPAVWSIDLRKRKSSILLEVLKLQSEKKPVELRGCSHEESEVRSFLQCLPHISRLSFPPWFTDSDRVKFCGNLFCAAAEREQQTGEKMLELLASVCTYKTFPQTEEDMDDDDDDYYDQEYQSDFLLDLVPHVKDYETETGLRVLPALQSVLSAPAVWSIDLSERKSSILLEVLKLQSEKKPVEVRGCSHEESEVRSFLQCLPHISRLSFPPWFRDSDGFKFCGNLFCAAAEREQQTGEKMLELLASVCTYKTFLQPEEDMGVFPDNQSDFLLDLFSHLKDYETETGLRVLPALQSVLSAPAVWSIDLRKRKSSILLEVLKLQSEKKPVKLRGCSHEESEVRSFLQCLPHISRLSCGPEFFQSVCSSIFVKSRVEAPQLASLLKLLGFTLPLTGELRWRTCRTVGRVLGLCPSDVDLILTPRKVSVRGAALLFRHKTRLHSLRLSSDMVLLLSRWVRRGRLARQVAVEDLSLAPEKAQPGGAVLLKVVSSLASLLRYWAVSRLDLTEFCVPARCLITLLLHDGPLTIKLSEENLQQLLAYMHEIQDEDLTLSLLTKVGGDLSSCRLDWELLHSLLQQSPAAQTITVNLRKNHFLQERVTRLLPFLDRILFKRSSPSFVLTAIREIYRAHASPIVPSLLRSLGHEINLTRVELDVVDCAALLFTLRHSDRVQLKLLWTSIPTGETESILFTLDKVSQLSVDRNLLLRFIHCCAASGAQQEAASGLFRTIEHRLDLSCSSCVELAEENQTETLRLTGGDCRAVSTVLRHSRQDAELDLRDCEVEDGGLDLLFPVLDRVRLRASNAVVLQLVSLVPVNIETDTVRRAVSLCRALGGDLDLSHTTLDQRTCGALALMLDFSEGLTELDLSHCRLTDRLLLTLVTHLHKVQVLDLTHNKITDASTGALLQLVSTNPSMDTVRLSSNDIVDGTPFKKDRRFELW